MRLFVALRPDAVALEGLIEIRDRLKVQCEAASLTRPENLHITLAFLGETQRMEDAKRAVEAVEAAPFSLTLDRMGNFKGRDRDLFWLGTGKSPELVALAEQVRENLSREKVAFDAKPFQAHVTLARRVRTGPGFDRQRFDAAARPVEMQISAVVLMESVREGGRLVYRPVHIKAFRMAE